MRLRSGLHRSRRRLLKLVAPFLAIVMLQAALACASMVILSSVRAYIAGESLWSKGQKEAVSNLQFYLQSRDADRLERYLEALAIPLGDLTARRALEQNPVDTELARQGFIAGGNHPEDVPGLIWMFRYFRWFPHFSVAVDSWRASDPPLEELVRIGAAIEKSFADNSATPADVASFKKQIERADAQLAPEALRFSESLGAGSRLVTTILTAVNLIGGAGLALLLIWYIRKLLTQRERFENALKAEKERAQVTLASIGDAVVATDSLGRIDYLNPAAERLIGVTCRDVQGRNVNRVFQIVESGEGAGLAAIAGAPAGGTVQMTHLVRPDGSRVSVSSSSAALNFGREAGFGYVLVLHDKTEEQEFMPAACAPGRA